jgi:hypothetical protein
LAHRRLDGSKEDIALAMIVAHGFTKCRHDFPFFIQVATGCRILRGSTLTKIKYDALKPLKRSSQSALHPFVVSRKTGL